MCRINITKFVFILGLFFILFSCIESKADGGINEELNYSNLKIESVKYLEIEIALLNKDSLLKQNPADYLKSLSYYNFEESNKMVNRLPFDYFINKEWVTKKDVGELMPFIRYKNLAKLPWPSIYSQKPKVNLTIGIEAMRLINIYRDTSFKYPAVFCTIDEQDQLVKEYINWWNKEQSLEGY